MRDGNGVAAHEAPTACRLESEDFACGDLGVRRVEGREALSELYAFTVLCAARDGAKHEPLDPDALVGASVRLLFEAPDGTLLRAVSGVVARARASTDEATSHPVYELAVAPRAHRLGLVTTQEIFQDMTVVEIIREKLRRFGLDAYAEFRTVAQYPKREFVVQYKETDLAFVSRIAEHVGVAFHFEEGDDGERMVWSDQNSGFRSLGEVPCVARGEERGIYALATESRALPARYCVQDYNYRLPDVDLGAVAPLAGAALGGVVEYGSHHKTPEEGEALAKIRAEEAACLRRQHLGKASAVSLAAGARVTAVDPPFGVPHELLVVEVRHHFEQTLGGDTGRNAYHNELLAIGAERTFRPERRTPRPRIHGVLSGMIQPGPDGELGGPARLDDQGRYTVQFHYDTVQRGEQKASRPVRMAQPFAGPDEGMHFPLRPGTEVLLAFVDGDPDRPVIVGALPNPQTPSPVVAATASYNRIKTEAGIRIQFGRSRGRA